MISLTDFGITQAAVRLSFLLICLLFLFIVSFLAVLFYLRATALYKMSEKLNLHSPWYGFIPFGCNYALGRVSDKREKGGDKKVFSLAKPFFVMGIVTVVLFLASIISSVNGLITLAFRVDELLLGENEIIDSVSLFYNTGILWICSILAFAIYKILELVALYRVYTIFAPSRAVLMLIVSIIFNFAYPIILFSIYKAPVQIKTGQNDDNSASSYDI